MPIQKTTPEEIIRNSIQVFREKGYYRTSLDDLAKAAGMSKGVFYHHFKEGKKEVMLLSLRAMRQWFRRHIFALGEQEGLSPKEKLEEIRKATFRAFTEVPGGCMFANTVLETALIEKTFLVEIRAFFDDWKDTLRNILANSYEGKELEDIVNRIITEVEGAIMLMQLYEDTGYLQKALEQASRYL